MDPEQYDRAIELLFNAAEEGISPVRTLREFRRMEQDEFARRTGMPVARIIGIETGRLPLTEDDTDAVAHVLDVPVDLLME
jgi:transcriptional regulator with XRE-family HTH domain